MLNVNEYFQVAMRSGKMQSECGGPGVSPKAGAPLVQTCGHELKLVYPQPEMMPNTLPWQTLCFEHYLLQPMDGFHRSQNIEAALRYCQAHPQWRLSLQLHKILSIR
jgi:organic radical activating enzyme